MLQVSLECPVAVNLGHCVLPKFPRSSAELEEDYKLTRGRAAPEFDNFDLISDDLRPSDLSILGVSGCSPGLSSAPCDAAEILAHRQTAYSHAAIAYCHKV